MNVTSRNYYNFITIPTWTKEMNFYVTNLMFHILWNNVHAWALLWIKWSRAFLTILLLLNVKNKNGFILNFRGLLRWYASLPKWLICIQIEKNHCFQLFVLEKKKVKNYKRYGFYKLLTSLKTFPGYRDKTITKQWT